MAPKLVFPAWGELARAVVDFCRLTPKDEHFKAVQLVCGSALEHYRGALELVEAEDALCAKVVSRALLETLVTVVILAKHPEKIEDFRECGRYFHLRKLHSEKWRDDPRFAEFADPRLASIRDGLISKHGADYKDLEKKFGRKLWHGLTRRAAFVEAGFDFDIYESFYQPTSEMAHAEPSWYVMRDNNDAWVFGRSDLIEARYLAGAYVSSSLLFCVGLDQINQALGLQFGERLAAYKRSLFEFMPKYKEALENAKDDKGALVRSGLKTAVKGLP